MTFIDKMIDPVLALPRPVKRVVVLCLDAGLCILTVWLALYLRLGEFVPLSGDAWPAAVAAPVLALPIFIRFGLYRAVFRYVGPDALLAIVNAVLVYGVIYFSVFTLFSVSGVPRTLGIIQPLLLLFAIGGSRLFGRYWLSGRYRELLRGSTSNRVLIYGAGASGRQLASAIGDSREMRVVGFLDDDVSLHGSTILGKRVYSPNRLPDLIERESIADVLLALPSVPRHRRNEIIAGLRQLLVRVRTLPGLLDLAHGHVEISDLRELTIEDLLGRDPVDAGTVNVQDKIADSTILVTGAGGSIGSELCRQLIKANPARLLLLEANEYALYAIHRSLNEYCPVELVPLLGSVTDPARMGEIMANWRPAMVFHAAAYKHVPLVEHNPLEGIRNNVFGTLLTAELAIKHEVRDFVLISTDKAVRPTNIMGASKRLSEMCLQALAAAKPATRLSMVRFGNVLGSSGSVVPLFREQIRTGGPVTITHRDITRYFMTIPEAAQLVVQASAMAHGGEMFVLDMGEPVKIYDLARNLIELSGFTVRDEDHPHGDIEIVTVGLRPGEKLYEELLIGNDPLPTKHPRIMMAREPHISLSELRPQLDQMLACIEKGNVIGARNLLCTLLPEYTPAEAIVDYVHVARTYREELVHLQRGTQGTPAFREQVDRPLTPPGASLPATTLRR